MTRPSLLRIDAEVATHSLLRSLSNRSLSSNYPTDLELCPAPAVNFLPQATDNDSTRPTNESWPTPNTNFESFPLK